MNQLPVSEDLWLQVYIASAGGIKTGTPLSEWTDLDIALRQMGIDLPKETEAATVTSICRAVVSSFYSQASIDRIDDLANFAKSGVDCHGCRMNRRTLTAYLREIATEASVPKASGHRWNFR